MSSESSAVKSRSLDAVDQDHVGPAVRCRILRGSRYSSQLSHSFARCIDSNSSTTMRFGCQSPSRTSVVPPRTMYLPPYSDDAPRASCIPRSRLDRRLRSQQLRTRPYSRLPLSSFVSLAGNFLRRRSRSQLFQVLRMLSRGVR